MSNDEGLINDEGRMTKVDVSAPDRVFDLEERTARFGEAVIRFSRLVQLTVITEPFVKQLVRAGASIGANYCEADDAGSKKEFRYRISVCKRESRETKHWLRMMAAAVPEMAQETRALWREAKELHLIFAAIFRSKSPK